MCSEVYAASVLWSCRSLSKWSSCFCQFDFGQMRVALRLRALTLAGQALSAKRALPALSMLTSSQMALLLPRSLGLPQPPRVLPCSRGAKRSRRCLSRALFAALRNGAAPASHSPAPVGCLLRACASLIASFARKLASSIPATRTTDVCRRMFACGPTELSFSGAFGRRRLLLKFRRQTTSRLGAFSVFGCPNTFSVGRLAVVVVVVVFASWQLNVSGAALLLARRGQGDKTFKVVLVVAGARVSSSFA